MSRRLTRREFIHALAAISGGLSLPLLGAATRGRAGTADARASSAPPAPMRERIGDARDLLDRLEPMAVHVAEDRVLLDSRPGRRLAGCRSVLYARPAGQAAWTESWSGALGRARRPGGGDSITIDFLLARANVVVEPLVGERVWRFSGRLTNTGRAPLELARFHYLDGVVPAGLGFLELAGPREQPALRSGASTLSPRADREQFWQSMGARWPQLAEPIHDQAGWFVSTDIAALVEGWNDPGWGFGFVGPGTAFGEIGYRGEPSPARWFLGTLLDDVILEPGKTRPLESAIVWHGDWQSGLDVWARVCADECGVRKLPAAWVGYCSWYRKQARITVRDIDDATRQFAAWPAPPGGRTIQIDDGFQVAPGDWDANERFRGAWPRLASGIAATGSLPGLWLAPTAVRAGSALAREHPEWLQRLPDGEPAITFGNWGPTHYLEPDHPEVRDWTRALFRRFAAGGWKYLKIDFTYAITAARVAFDRRKTRFQTLRDLFALIREAVGPEVRLNADVGSLARYALGHADAARVGGDMDYRPARVSPTVDQLLARACTNGVWWWNDPDCFVMTHEQLTDDEARIFTGTFGLMGGLFLTSDLPSQWSTAKAAFVRQFWNVRGPLAPRRQRVLWDRDGRVAAYRVSYDAGHRPAHRIALYNWTDAPRDMRVRLSDLHLDPSAGLRLAREGAIAGATMSAGAIAIVRQPAHSLRIVDLEQA